MTQTQNQNRNRAIFPVKLSSLEKEIIKEKAQAQGMKVGTYIRYMALSGEASKQLPKARSPIAQNIVPEINISAYRQLCGIANNLNQLTRAVNASVKHNRELDSNLTNLLKETIKTVQEAAFKITNKKRN